VTRRLLATILAVAALWAFAPVGAASAQESPAPPTDPVQTILSVFSPFTTEPCSLVGLVGVVGNVPAYGQVLNVCGQFPLPAQRSVCAADTQVADALNLPVPLPLPTPAGSAVDSVAAAQQAVGSTTGQPPPDVAGPLGQSLQCSPVGQPSADQAAPAPAPDASADAALPAAVEGETLGDAGSALATPALATVDGADHPATNTANAAAAGSPSIALQATATKPVGDKDSGNGVVLALILGGVAIAVCTWLYAGNGQAAIPDEA